MAITVDNEVFLGIDFTPQAFAEFATAVTPGASGVIEGCTVTAPSSATIAIAEGRVTIKGRILHVSAGNITITLPADTKTMYLQLAVNLAANPSASISVVETRGTDDTNFNEISGKAYFTVAKFTASASGISNIINAPLPIAHGIIFGTSIPTADKQAEWFQNGTIYYQKTDTGLVQWVKYSDTWYQIGTSSSSSSSSGSSTDSGSSSSGSSTDSDSSSSGSATTGTTYYTYTVTGSEVYLRSAASSSASSFGTVSKGTVLASEQSGIAGKSAYYPVIGTVSNGKLTKYSSARYIYAKYLSYTGTITA